MNGRCLRLLLRETQDDDGAKLTARKSSREKLVAAIKALPDATTIETLRVVSAATARAGVASRPTQRHEMGLTGHLGAELRHKIVQGQAFLKLNPIHRHVETPFWMRLAAMLSMHTAYPMRVPEASN